MFLRRAIASDYYFQKECFGFERHYQKSRTKWRPLSAELILGFQDGAEIYTVITYGGYKRENCGSQEVR